MGIPIEPGEKGPDCPTCTPTFWAVGETPKQIMVNVTGIIKCPGLPPQLPAAPTGPFILTQKLGSPCLWELTTADYVFSMAFTNFASSFTIRSGGFDWFLWGIGPVCDPFFYNELDHCDPLWAGRDGSAFADIFDFPGTAYQLMYEYGLNPVEHSKFDVLEVPGEPPYVQVRRCANIRTPMNIKIKTDATHKDQFEMFEK